MAVYPGYPWMHFEGYLKDLVISMIYKRYTHNILLSLLVVLLFLLLVVVVLVVVVVVIVVVVYIRYHIYIIYVHIRLILAISYIYLYEYDLGKKNKCYPMALAEATPETQAGDPWNDRS